MAKKNRYISTPTEKSQIALSIHPSPEDLPSQPHYWISRSGELYKSTPDEYYCTLIKPYQFVIDEFNLSITKSEICKARLHIVLQNAGQLKRVRGLWHDMTDGIYEGGNIEKIQECFFEDFTLAQIEALRDALSFLGGKFNIPVRRTSETFKYKSAYALTLQSGLFSSNAYGIRQFTKAIPL